MDNRPWYVYIVKAADESLYTGISPNPKKRETKHNLGKGAKFLRGKLPVILVYSERFPNKSEATKREMAIKNLKREYKLKLIHKGKL